MISEPMFSSSIHGLSSFAGYHLPKEMSNNMELTFKIKPNTIDQISLLLFIGQHGFHDSTSDHMSVSYVKGYIVLTWNLGSGTFLVMCICLQDFYVFLRIGYILLNVIRTTKNFHK